MMSIENKIKEFVISFFKISNFKIFEECGVFTVMIPEQNQNYFKKSKLVFAFNEKISNDNKCELIVPGSKTLFQIITLCNNKSTIIKKQSKNPKGFTIIRYHFFVDFSGMSKVSKLFSIDVDLERLTIVKIIDELSEKNFIINPESLLKNITKSFIVALDELQEKTSKIKSNFLNSNEIEFQKDYNAFVTRFDDEIRELDNSINEKEKSSNDPKKIKKYMFTVNEKIHDLEKDKNELINNIQKKYKINLNYNLIACELILC